MESTPPTPSAPHLQAVPTDTRLVDPHGRRLHYLRLSITDLCNLRCCYCMPAQGVKKLARDQVLTLEELALVGRAAVELGVDKIRLTGGEPLLRPGLEILLTGLAALDPRPDLRITTNGTLLAEKLTLLVDNGVSTINLSLDTLKPERFGRISGLGEVHGAPVLESVRRGMDAVLADGRASLKINVVLLGGVNDDELVEFARLTREAPVAVRFIEYMPVGYRTCYQPDRFLSAAEALDRVAVLGTLESLEPRPGDGPARRYRLPGAAGELGVISALSNHFCGTCNRLRVSAEGRVVPCLFSQNGIDLKPALRRGQGLDGVKAALMAAAQAKPARHAQAAAAGNGAGEAMSRLGG